MDESTVEFRSATGHAWAALVATAGSYLQSSNAYLIDIIRWPLFPLILYATWQISYRVSGQTHIGGVEVAGFLLIGMVGQIVWTVTIWAGGYAIEYEREGGTAAALFLSPVSRAAVVAGYGVGGLIWALPALGVVALLGFLTGARLAVADLMAFLVATGMLAISALAMGFALASLFVLSRRANLLANFLQRPLYLLGGFVVPIERLPEWLQRLSALLPITHATAALRAAALQEADLLRISGEIGLALFTSVAFALLGIASLRRVEHVAKHAGRLDLY